MNRGWSSTDITLEAVPFWRPFPDCSSVLLRVSQNTKDIYFDSAEGGGHRHLGGSLNPERGQEASASQVGTDGPS